MFGATFAPKKWLFLSMIKDSTLGIAGHELAWVFYPGMSHRKAMDNVRVQINQINDQLVHTDWRIINKNKTKRNGAIYKLKESKR